MSDYKIFLSPPSQNGHEKAALDNALASNWLAPVGPAINAFEGALQQLHEGKKILALNSGTAAIHLALQLCGVGDGDEVLVASHTHNATVNPIIYCGGRPVFVDSESDTWNISPDFLRNAILDRIEKGQKPKAILVVHLYGMSARIDKIMDIASAFDIPVIEDAAEALGARFQNRPLGTFGHYGILSFNGNKIITTSGGGALICPDQKAYQRALFLATQARDEAPYFQHSEIGYNYRLSNVLAALGSAQLQDLDQRVAQRRAIFDRYKNAFQALNAKLGVEIIRFTHESKDAVSNRWLSTFLIAPHAEITHETWRTALAEHRIESRPLWKPMHLQPVFQSFPFYGNHTSDAIFAHGICLPSGQALSLEEQNEIIQIIENLYVK